MNALRKLLVVAILGGGGYGYYYTQVKSGGGVPVGIGVFSGGAQGTLPHTSAATNEQGFEEVKSQGLDQIFRLDVKPGWVLANWKRVTTGLSDVDLQGYRVVLITGTGETDLAGSLSYYFDNLQRLRRITFAGTTGDTRPLVAFFEQRFGFRHQVTREARVVTYAIPRSRFRLPGRRRNQLPERQSRLEITPAPVVSRGNPNARFGVELRLEVKQRPGGYGAAARRTIPRK